MRQILDANKWKLKAIYNTHANADHIGGNKYLQAQTGCKIYVPGIDCEFTRNPVLEPSFLFGGYPPKDLRHKFLMAQGSDAEYLTREALPAGFEAIPLPGHFFDMVGFRTPDNVVYLADCLSSRDTLEKYRMTDSIAELAQYNIDQVNEIADRILALCETPCCFEELLRQLFDAYALTMNFEQYVLVGSTVRSYLAWLKDAGRLDMSFEENRMLWSRKQ